MCAASLAIIRGWLHTNAVHLPKWLCLGLYNVMRYTLNNIRSNSEDAVKLIFEGVLFQVFDDECEEFEDESLYTAFFGQLKVSLLNYHTIVSTV